ncbi:aldo/keto reductase [Francisella adeliensis]|uniref:Aldo/keto reductase n=1 Tax=Francisella adeliensis TaxID=2007306 RepID=A0A2Z4XYE2_9GAMM|nr:aldo/keto reductase [Francisella adeliensis]AXA33809.1 aldo/keto reductase [Francisella adeliensis]MBK2085708.1 aldo/keto reductase [Francisella adeliensis]MBK2097586.1 aldo/keto reductase [Francisella adeliensis]QIW12044.1 aldo/keto reductase [Francisella adeliensis]QIW13919.1 aldo/keto reductase [Francisella adeliensis]
MKYLKLGNTDIDVSRICLGTMTWGKQNTQAEGFEQMDYALSQGVNFWDTAEMYAVPPCPKTYGKTEEIIGNWFKISNKRDNVILATKFSPIPWARGEENPVINKQNIITAVDNSLKRLQTDYIDLYQFHWAANRPNYHFAGVWDFIPDSSKNKEQIEANILEILQTCNDLVKEGKIKNIGLSNDTTWGINKFISLAEKHNLPKIQSIQHEYSLLRRRDETDVMETCSLENLSYLAWSPLNMGVLSGKYLGGNRPDGTRLSKEVLNGQEDRFMTRTSPTVDKAVAEYMRVANKHGLDVCQMALAFTIRRDYMSSTIIGATNLEQLKSNIDAVNLELSEEVLKDIEIVRRKYPVPF